MKTIILFLSIGLFSTAAQPDGGWSKKSKKAFTAECVIGAMESIAEDQAVEYCACMLEKVMLIYPDPEDADKMTEEEVMPMARECLSIESWPEDSKEAFTTECVGGAEESVGKELAITYCQCMLEKVMVLYPNPLDADKLTEEEVNAMVQGCMVLE